MSSHMIGPAAAPAPETRPGTERLTIVLGLAALVWLVGAVSHFSPLREWPATYLYVLGALWLTYVYGHGGRWARIYITRRGLGRAVLWGGGVGAALMLLDWGNTYLYYRGGGAPMVEMETILIGLGLIYLFPLLVLAEEFLWRGMLLSALRDRGLNSHLCVAITTALYAANHFFVAPVGLRERGLMALMALPIGIIGGYLTLRLRNVWAAVIIHMLTFVSMIVDIVVMPGLAAG